MTATEAARSTVRRISDSPILAGITRVGFVGYGLFHLAIAWLAVQIALGRPAASGDQSGAFSLLRNQPAGLVVLIVVVVGLAAMALWQLSLALLGHRNSERVLSLGRTLIYTFLAWTGYRILTGSQVSSSRQQRDATATVLHHTAGRWLVGLAGLVLVGIAVGMIAYGLRRSFVRKLDLGRAAAPTRAAVIRLGQLGYTAKGVAVGIVGVLVLQVALDGSEDRAGGLDTALHTLSRLSYGTLLLVLIGLGFAAHGVYCFFQARYRRV